MTRHWKRLVILLVAYAGAVCAAFSGWFGGRAYGIIKADPTFNPSFPEATWAVWLFAGAVALGVGFLILIERLVPADPPPERK